MRRFVTDEWYDRIVASILPWLEAGRSVTFVWPTPGFASSDASHDLRHTTNAIPAAVAADLADVIGGELNDSILQVARPGRTRLTKLQRYLYQPIFDGDVDPITGYVLVDDTYTTGGTLAALRSYILASGGTVISACALCTSGAIPGRKFSLADSTHAGLMEVYGPDLVPFWIEEVGHDPRCLTDDEGELLRRTPGERGWEPPLQRLRGCFLSLRTRDLEA